MTVFRAQHGAYTEPLIHKPASERCVVQLVLASTYMLYTINALCDDQKHELMEVVSVQVFLCFYSPALEEYIIFFMRRLTKI